MTLLRKRGFARRQRRLDVFSETRRRLQSALTLFVQGVCPPFIPKTLRMSLSELRGFRHVFVHSYDPQLDSEKAALLLKYARQASEELAALMEKFILGVAIEHRIELQ